MRTGAPWRLGPILATMVVLAGCGSDSLVSTTAHHAMAATSSALPSPAPSCGSTAFLGHPTSLPKGLHLTAVFECDSGSETVSGRGRWLVQSEREATHDLGVLLAALRRPSQVARGNLVCPAVAISVPSFVVVGGGGQVLRPRIPTDACGQPQEQALDALASLPWTIVSRRLVRQIDTRAEVASGCASGWKDVFALYAGRLRPAAGGSVFRSRPRMLRICVYRDVGHSQVVHADGRASQLPIGHFVHGGEVSGSAEATLLDGIAGGRRSVACPTPHSAFAVVSDATLDNGQVVYVGLGHCHRVLHSSHSVSGSVTVGHEEVGQASPAALAIIDHVRG